MRLQRFLIGFTLIAMPFFLGGARPWIWPVIAAGFFLGVVFLLCRHSQTDFLEGISSTWLAVFAALLVYPVLQVVPLPESWLGTLSPHRMLWLQRGQQVSGLPVWLKSVSYTPLETVFEGFAWWLFLAVFALVLRKVLQKERRLDWLFNLLFVFAGFEALYGLLQVLIPSLGVLWEAEGQGLARGTFVNRNHYACFLGMLWPVLLAYIFGLGIKDYGLSSRRTQRGPQDHLSYPERERLSQVRQKQMFYGFIIGLMILGIFFSQSRGGIIGSIISLTVLIAVSKKMRTKGMLFLVVGAWTVMLAYGSIIGFDDILRRFDQIDVGASGRFQIWETALLIIKDHPWTGTGVGSFGDLFRVYQTYLNDIQTTNFAHNDYLHLMVELGVPVAALLFVLVWGYWWKTAYGLARGKGQGARGGVSEMRRGPDAETGGDGEKKLGLGIKDYGLSNKAESSKLKAERKAEDGRRRTEGRSLNPASSDEQRRLITVGALAGSAAFLCHSWGEFNWQIPANALYFVMLLVIMKDGEVNG